MLRKVGSTAQHNHPVFTFSTECKTVIKIWTLQAAERASPGLEWTRCFTDWFRRASLVCLPYPNSVFGGMIDHSVLFLNFCARKPDICAPKPDICLREPYIVDRGAFLFLAPVESKGLGRKVLERDFAYDGEKTLFTLGSLVRNKLEFTVVLEHVISSRNNGNCSPDGNGEPNESDKKWIKHPFRDKTFRVETSFASKTPLQAITNALCGRNQRIFKKQY
ncbi:Protein argonaute 4, partial [Mucuna pruriens]